MSTNNSNESLSQSRFANGFVDLIKQERIFIGLVGILFFVAGIATPYAHLAMWVGFFLAGYSAIANDSIQTIGTFIASNSKPLVVTMVIYGWNIFCNRIC